MDNKCYMKRDEIISLILLILLELDLVLEVFKVTLNHNIRKDLSLVFFSFLLKILIAPKPNQVEFLKSYNL